MKRAIFLGCVAASLALGCKVDEAKREPASSAASTATRTIPPPVTAARAAPRAAPTESWNDEAIAWRTLDEGLQEAKQSGKTVMLVVYTNWCPHCRNYSKVFSDDRLVQASKKLVMIRMDQDQHKAEAARYAPDGQYVPRTLFLTSSGDIMQDVKAREDKFNYFYREDDPTQVLGAMSRVAK